MNTPAPGSTIAVPYGIDALPSSYRVPAAASVGLAMPLAFIARGRPQTLRINCAQLARYGSAFESEPATNQFDAIQRYLEALAGPWVGLSRRFLAWYLETVTTIVEQHRAELEAKIAPYEGLYRIEDWRYSAPVPLPRAFPPAPLGERRDLSDPDLTAADHLQVEILFCISGQLIAVESENHGLLPKHAVAREARLAAVGIDRVAYVAQDLRPGRSDLMHRLIGPELAFWLEDILPAGPILPDLPHSV